MKEDIKEKIYKAMDSFLVESEDIKGDPIIRSVERLNEDRHLFVREMKKIIEAVCDEMIGKEVEVKDEIRGSILQAFKQITDQRTNIGYNCRVKEEKEIKKQIIENL